MSRTKPNATELARILKVLSVAARVRIVQLLKGRALCVNALASQLDVTQGAVSQHLRIMRDADLVIGEKRGYFVHYRLNAKVLVAWQGAIDKLLAPNSAKGPRRKKGAGPCAKMKRNNVRNPRT
ncbi:MAG: winged helix-turn-helix transcriptional regulator [Phycisphaerae bacterium]|nr:winged helix-turn-helix transcriptional regulator [Phycisphaerae bacterium]